jgi:hypothetical protein
MPPAQLEAFVIGVRERDVASAAASAKSERLARSLREARSGLSVGG